MQNNYRDIFSANLQTYYLAVSTENDTNVSSNVPSFPLNTNSIMEILLQLPSFPLQYMGVATNLMTKSNGNQVFAEVANPIDFLDIASKCNLPPGLLWNSILRIVVSPNSSSLNMFLKNEICTIYLPIPWSSLD